MTLSNLNQKLLPFFQREVDSLSDKEGKTEGKNNLERHFETCGKIFTGVGD